MIKKIRKQLAKILSGETHVETYFNLPFKFTDEANYCVNERIIEVPFVFSELNEEGKIQKILDFGCTRSWLAVSLASLGYNVFGIDLRDYPIRHTNLVFKKQNIMELEEKDFDVVIAVSSLEHVGIGAYGEEYNPSALPKVMSKLYTLLRTGGRLLLTVPVGKSSIDTFMKSFTPDEIEGLATSNGFIMLKNRYYKRESDIQWSPCSRGDIVEISNHSNEMKKRRSGVNAVGCLTFRK